VYFEKKIFNNYRSSKNGDQNKLPVHVVIALFLEKNGLAMSSRNERLTTKEKQQQLYL
jgi:pantothenate synthetase